MNTILNQESGETWTAIHGDCMEALKDIPDNSIDFSVYSPPFSSLYIYSESIRDCGNVAGDEEFHATYLHALTELFRITKPGRLTCIHVKDLVFYSNASEKGDRGLRDFTGDCIRTHLAAGWTYHSRTTVWRCPVREMTKAKPDGLLYKNFRLDAGRVRQGLPEYMIVFRKWTDDEDQAPPVQHLPGLWPEWAGEGAQFVGRRVDHAGLPEYAGLSDAQQKADPRYLEALDVWQQWASPVWMDTSETNVLNVRVARDEEAEKHLCPMPLDLIDRAIRLWSNPGEVVLSPFMGIGSEGWGALRAGRKFVGVELKDSYFRTAVKNLRQAEADSSIGSLFDVAEAEEAAE